MIYFIRHGKTKTTIEKKLNWWEIDEALDETAFSDFENKEFIEKIKKLNIELIVVSPLKRAFETAKIIKNYLDSTVELITDERFKEQMFGEFSWKEVDKILLENPWYDLSNISLLYRMGNNFWESRYDFVWRVKEWFEELKSLRKNILIVSHGWVYRALMQVISGKSDLETLSDINYRLSTLEIKNIIS